MRYFRNQKGGTINVYFDGKLMKEVDTYDQISNKFEWKKIGTLKAEEDKHTLTLQNVAGFNAVNILAILPNHELEKLTSKAEMFSNNARIINIMEGESNFYNDKGNYTGTSQYLSGNNHTDVTSTDGRAATILKGQFKVPRNANFANIEYIVNKNNSAQNSSATLDLSITPSKNKDTVFRNEFERNRNASAPLALIRQHEWINYDKDLVSTSLDKTNPLEGNYSLGVNIKPSTKAGWNILSTDFIPIYGDRYYNTSLSISAKDILQLHSRVLYFDSKKESLEGSADYIFRGKDGTVRNNFSSSILPPLSAKYLKLQILSLSANPKPSWYLLDNVKLEEITMPSSVYHNKYAINAGIENNTGSETRIIRENSTHYVLETQPFTVNEGNTYNYNLDTTNMQIPPTALVVFKNSNDVIQSPKYGNNASQGQVLSLSPKSEVEGTFNVMKPSNYTLSSKDKNM